MIRTVLSRYWFYEQPLAKESSTTACMCQNSSHWPDQRWQPTTVFLMFRELMSAMSSEGMPILFSFFCQRSDNCNCKITAVYSAESYRYIIMIMLATTMSMFHPWFGDWTVHVTSNPWIEQTSVFYFSVELSSILNQISWNKSMLKREGEWHCAILSSAITQCLEQHTPRCTTSASNLLMVW